MGAADQVNASAGREVETLTQRNYGANHEWFPDSSFFAADNLSGELKSPLRISLPKIYPWSEPVIAVVTGLEGRATQ